VNEVTLSTNSLGRKNWVSPVTMELHSGEILGLSGLLGSGRTEIIKMLFGAMPADCGEMKIRGNVVRTKSPREALGLGMAYCPEDRRAEGILPNLSVRENLIIAMQTSRGATRLIPRAEQNALASHYIEALKIKTPSAETPISNLSGGNQQKVLLARCLLLQPQIILLDEPTRGIDVGAKVEIEKLLHSLRSQGLSVLLVSSDLEEIARNCNRVMVMRDRRKAGDLSGDAIKPDSIMRVIANAST
jgi:simple sugar transport system ATP-binding protein